MLKKHILFAVHLIDGLQAVFRLGGDCADASANGRTASLACVPFKSRLETVEPALLLLYVGASAAAFNLVSCA